LYGVKAVAAFEAEQLILFPNPTKGDIQIKGWNHKETIFSLTILDSRNIILHQEANATGDNLSSKISSSLKKVAAGIYLVVINGKPYKIVKL
jgi:hypothetical protein